MNQGKAKGAKYKINFVDRVLDPVHGFIDLTQVEKEIIELPIFKRMQSIKQLSLTNWIFPGAEHTRYMHSLGVMHIADSMALNLKTIDNKPFFKDKDRQLLRLAGLLHDIGHYPLSHVTESVYNSNLLENEGTLIKHNEEIKKRIDKIMIEKTMPDYMKNRETKPMHHETMGIKVIEFDSDIKSIIKKYCPFINIEDIQNIIVGNVENNPSISAMVQLIHSELDADGIDYVMRDATFSGTSYGGFELGLLLRNLVVTKYNGIDIVGIRPKGISIVDQYLLSKYFSYTQIIYNRHVSVLGTMAEIFSSYLIELDKSSYPKPEILKKYVELHSNNDEYLKFTDRAFWTQLDSLTRSDLLGFVPDYVVSIYDKLTHYQELQMVKDGEIIITSNNKEHVGEILKSSKIYTDIANKKDDIIVIYQSRKFTSEIPEQEYKLLLKELDQESTFFQKNIKRLQEGIAVIDKGKNPKLLVDDSRSIMSHLYDTETFFLREYFVK